MAMESVQDCSQNSYMCRVCGQLLFPSRYDLCTDYREEIIEHLHEKYILSLSVDVKKNIRIRKQIPVPVDCINKDCSSSVECIANVEADCALSKEELNDNYDVIDYEYELTDAHVTEFCHNKNVGEVNLRIVCQTKVGVGAKCYIGYEEQTGTLVRPVRSVYDFQWPNSLLEFQIGEVYTFKVLAYKEGTVNCHSDVPHRHEDIVIDEAKITANRMRNIWDPSALLAIARSNMFDIFRQEHLKELKYVEANTDCPSVGVLTVSERDLTIYPTSDRKRIKIRNNDLVFDFPVTAISFDSPERGRDRHALVLLGLGRPYESESETFNPPRCYVLVLAIYLF